MIKSVIIHAKFTNLPIVEEQQTGISFENIDDDLDNSILFYKINETLHLDKSDINMDVYACQFSERHSYDHAFFKGHEIPYVDEKHSFKAYVCNERNVIFFNVKTDVALKFIKKCNTVLKQRSSSLIEVHTIDFDSIERKATEIKGSWFSMESSQVTSQALLGNNIENSIEFESLKENGYVSSLTIQIFLSELESTLSVGISKKGSIYIQNKLPSYINPIDILWLLFIHLVLD
ncbi:hypothetical protein PT070_07980 [Erysipelothrix rhusiopathiae]|nr:hypothetical protein [Erysipelothrix rhusiopathiae]MDE8079197.1 hypothetical protein [Erysipelothrix rhusiopathiae]MDE8084272.1 hypothetical protein [Erysipelothrix rhusiopathiae]MDE8094552.1 hypothetical protein [Erysipelothrix rhusiopathiae]MDE8161576.1 hypothetical protein [Erysipelothrix rhusiopathiae]